MSLSLAKPNVSSSAPGGRLLISSKYELGKAISVSTRFLAEMGAALGFSSFDDFQTHSIVKKIRKGSVLVKFAVNMAALSQNNVDPTTAIANAKLTDFNILTYTLVANNSSKNNQPVCA